MKIALCKSHFAGPVSGADETLVTYAIKLKQSGHDVHVALLYKHSNNDGYYRRLECAGVPVDNVIKHSVAFMLLRALRNSLGSILLFIFLIPRSTESLRKIWQLVIDLISRVHYRECKTQFAAANYDLLHVFTPDTGATLMIRAGNELGIPVLYHEMGTPGHLPALDPYYKKLEKVLPLCTEVAALSPSLANQWQARFPFLPWISTLPLISDDAERMPVFVNKRDEEIVFGYAGRVEAGKGPFVLVEALNMCPQNGVRSMLRIAGTGPDLLQMKKLVRTSKLSGRCEFVGAYSGALGCSAFMRSLDVFVLPSFAEGTANSVIEAMAHGLPIITTNVGGLPDLITPAEGILVPPGNSALLAAAMKKLACDRDLRMRMGVAARKRYLKLFATDAVLPMLSRTYSRLAGTTIPVAEDNVVHPWEHASYRCKTTQVDDRPVTPSTLSSAFDLLPELFAADENAAS
ncbi:MAG TPA: glycosyltransferase family 4 protein [Pyrinomonadaceae bacterium]|nr:glycosyltransferase family 4 protein [Pyrinomonadaceae bacterium]